MKRMNGIAAACLLATAAVRAGYGQAADKGLERFHDTYKELVETNTALSSGDCTLAATRMADRLKAAGYSDADVRVFVPDGHPKEGGLLAVLHGTDRSAKAILMLAHIDVVEARREDGPEGSLVEIQHSGYSGLGLNHHRRLFLGDSGEDFRGEDALIGSTPQRFAIRFHFHPDVQVSLTGTGHTALLKLGDGTGWRFRSDMESVKLEDSVYFGSGPAPRRSTALVVSGRTEGDNTIVRWAFRREKRTSPPSS